jgi:hypothetical protein
MNTGDFRNTSLPAWWIALAFALVSVAGAASLSEPPRIVHGKIVKLGQGGGYQLFSGNLRVKLRTTRRREYRAAMSTMS